MTVVHTRTLESPLGLLRLADGGRGLCAMAFVHGGRPWSMLGLDAWFPAHRLVDGDTDVLARARDWLSAYFRGEMPSADGIDLDLHGSDFERRVWSRLLEIPPGEVLSYGDLAAAVGRPGAARAVGGAVGRNPVHVLVPCHRVVGATGDLTGYAAGLERKQWLLQHEGSALF